MRKPFLRGYLNRLYLGIILLGVGIAIALFLYIRDNEQKNLEYNLKLAIDEHYHAVYAEADILDKVLQGLRGLYRSSDWVDGREFSRFARDVALRHHYIKGVFWAPNASIDPPAYPIQFTEPDHYQQTLGGLDLAADPELRRQLQASAEKGQLLVRPERLDSGEQVRHSMRLYLPIYQLDNQHLRGFIVLMLDFNAFLDAALSHRTATSRSLDLAIVDPNNDRLLLHHPVDRHTRPAPNPRLQQWDYRRPLQMLEQKWELLLQPVPGRFPRGMSLMPWFALFATLAITFLIAGIINSNMTRRSYAESLVADRTRALQNSEERLTELYNIVASTASFADKTRAMLAYGCKQLGMQYGILSHIEHNNYTLQYTWSTDNSLQENTQFKLGDTCCDKTLLNNTVTSFSRAKGSEWERHPCYEIFNLEAYIGTPIYVNNQLYGTLNFSSTRARDSGFTQSEHELVQLMAQWLGMELSHIQFEDRLLEQRNTISHILESTAEAFVAVDRQQTILYTNSLTRELLNLDTEEMVGLPLQEVAPELVSIFGDALNLTLNNNQSTQFDSYYPDSNKWLEVAIHPTLQGASMSLRDITEQKVNAEILSHTLGIKNAILNSANFTIIATDVEGLIVSFNNAAERLLGYSASEMIGRHTPALFHDPEEITIRARELSEKLETPIEAGFEAFIALARQGTPDEHEWTYICHDGTRIPILLSITEMTDEEGNCIGFLGIGVDITERKRIERMRDEFVSTVSHELRTPLTSIRGSLGLLSGNLSAQLPEQAHSLIDIAGRNADRLLHLINDILDINKIESGKMSFDYQPMQLADFLQQAVENNLAYARPFNVELILAEDLPEETLYADEHRLMQVMNNLLSNAVKFSRSNETVEIDARVQHTFVRISVTDHGRGIASEFHQKVFDRFSQADASDSRNTGGTGLGLSIARAIVEQHGGQIDFVSQPGIGTTFYFDLPIYQHQTLTRIKDQIISLAPPHTHRLLICEDDPDIAGLLQLMLARHGYQSDICHNTEQTLKALEEHHYDALLLDILLPDRSGLDLIRELRENETTRHLPVIVVSAVANEARNELHGGAANIVDWLDKPLDQKQLLRAVQQALQHLPDKPHVLYVEDETDLQQLVGVLLQDQVHLTCAASLQEAHARLTEHSFELVLLDVTLPDGSGLTLLEYLKDQQPPPATVIFSNSELEIETPHRDQISAALLKSTTSRQSLLQTLAACLQQRARHSAESSNSQGDS